MERIIVLGGKGGVGKSSISAATALKLSQLLPNKKILIISFDMAHNLSDLFLKEIGNKITQLSNNLWGIEPDPNIYAEEYTRNLLVKMKALMKQMPFVGFIPQIENFINTTFTSDSIPLALKNAIFFQKILDAEDLTQEIQFDIIIAGDIIEHLANVGKFLFGIRHLMSHNTTFILTTPNAFRYQNLVLSLFNRTFEGEACRHMFTD